MIGIEEGSNSCVVNGGPNVSAYHKRVNGDKSVPESHVVLRGSKRELRGMFLGEWL